ncbi:hypothetical protein Tco_0142739, partial [Tanacetum coccineum]
TNQLSIWRPTGKKLTLGKLDCGSQWRPTGKKFVLGEMCHLTKLSVKCRTGHALVSGDSGCSKHMTGNRSKLMNFVEKFIGRSTNLYTISIDEMMKSSPICLLSKASKSKSWLMASSQNGELSFCLRNLKYLKLGI